MNLFAYTKNPLKFIDPLGLDSGTTITAAVWRSNLSHGSVGHVYLSDANGNTLTRQFSDNSSHKGINITKDWNQTIQYEGRPPDAVYQIQVPDANTSNSQAATERNKSTWDWWPTNDQQTNCTIAANNVLVASGKSFTLNPKTPDTFDVQLHMLSLHPESGVTKIKSMPPQK
jgi:hypothetical protein